MTSKTTNKERDTDAMKIERWPIGDIHPYPGNAKLHPEEQIERLARTIGKFDWDQPIVVDRNGVIIKGHGRRLAAIKLGMEAVPVLVRRDLSASEADALRIADNAVVSGAYDTRMMQAEIARLMADVDVSFELGDLGLSAKDHDLMASRIDEAETAVLMADTGTEMDRVESEDAERIDASDRELVPLAEAFGFKKLVRAQARLVGRLLGHAEAATGKTGADAFMGWLQAQADAGVI